MVAALNSKFSEVRSLASLSLRAIVSQSFGIDRFFSI